MDPDVDDEEAIAIGKESLETEAVMSDAEAERGGDQGTLPQDESLRRNDSDADPDDPESHELQSEQGMYSESPGILSVSASPTIITPIERGSKDDDRSPQPRPYEDSSKIEGSRNQTEFIRRELRRYQISNSQNGSQKHSRSPPAKDRDGAGGSTGREEATGKEKFDGRLEDKDGLQGYLVQGMPSPSKNFDHGVSGRYEDEYDIPIRSFGRSRRRDSSMENTRQENFDSGRRLDGPRYEASPEQEGIRPAATPRRGRQRIADDIPNPFAQGPPQRAKSRERLRPEYLRPAPASRVIYDRSRSRNRSSSSVRRELPRVVYDDPERLRYIHPTGRAGNSLKIDLNLTPTTSVENLPHHAKQSVAPGPQPWQSMYFETSCGTTNESGIETVVLAQSPLSEGGVPHLRWIHMQQASMSIEALQDLLLNADISDDDLLMALRLLQQVTIKAEKELSHSYILDPLVIRGDGHAVRHTEEHSYFRHRERQPDSHCTFLNFPYFSLQKPVSIQLKTSSKLHFARGLLQTLYRLESTGAREEEQAICKDRNSSEKSICVQQLWSILIGTDLMITYSPHSLSSMVGESIQIQKLSPKLRSMPSILRVTDAFQKTLLFPLDQCKSWFEVEELIYTQFELSPYSHSIFLQDRTVLKASMWPSVLASTKSPFIDLLIDVNEDPYSLYYDSKSTSDAESDLTDIEHRQVPRQPDISRRHRYRAVLVERPINIDRPIIADDWQARNRSQTRQRIGDTMDRSYEEPIYGDSNALVLARRLDSNTKQRGYSPWSPEDDRYPVVIRRPRRPDSYYPDSRRDDPQEHSYNQSRALVLYQNQASTTQNYYGRPQLEPAPAPRRSSTYVDRYQPQNLRRASTVDANYYNDYTIAPRIPTNDRYDDSGPVELNSHSYRRGRPAPNGIIINDTIEEEKEEGQLDMYFIPKAKWLPNGKKEGSENNRPLAGATGSEIPLPNAHRPWTSKAGKPFGKPSDDKSSTRLGHSTINLLHERPIIPIFLWPNGPPNTIEKSQKKEDAWARVFNTRNTLSIDRGSKIGPPRNTASSNELSRDNLQGLSEVLQGLDESFTDDTQPGRLYHSMEPSNLREFAINMPNYEPQTSVVRNEPFRNVDDDPSDRPRRGGIRSSSSSSGESLNIRFSGKGQQKRRLRERELRDARIAEVEAEKLRRAYIAAQDEAIRRRPAVPSSRPTLRDPSSSSDESVDSQLKRVDSLVERPRSKQQKYSDPINTAEAERQWRKLISAQAEKDKRRPSAPSGRLDGRKKSLPRRNSSRQEGDDPLLKSPADRPELSVVVEPTQSGDKPLLEFVTRSKELLVKFIPPNDTSIVTGKYFGTVEKIVELIQKIHDDCYSESLSHDTELWIIDDISIVLHNYYQFLPRPSKPLTSCKKCTNRTPYRTEAEASRHLIAEHFQGVEDMTKDQTKLWIKQEKQKINGDKRKYAQSLMILRECSRFLRRANKKMQEIHEGVYSTDSALSPCYRLPNTLVESFRMTLGILLWTSFALERVAEGMESSSSWTSDDGEKANSARRHLRTLGRSLIVEIEDGKHDLLAMVRTQQQSKSIRKTQDIGPQYVLAMVLSNLQLGVDCEDLIEVYKRYIERLSFQANQFPRRRLIRSFIYLDEETKIIYETLTEQLNLLTDLYRVLDPRSFRATTECRVSQFSLETSSILKLQTGIEVKRADLLEMGFQIERLIQQTKTSLEIKDDDHGKAILVFTTVTLVFLPLSFVSSFFGMNTVDIRNMNSGQSRFWIVAVPVTVGILALALFVGYKLEAIREWIEKNAGKMKKD